MTAHVQYRTNRLGSVDDHTLDDAVDRRPADRSSTLLLTALKVAMIIAVAATWIVVGWQYWENPHTVHSLGGIMQLLAHRHR
jgi:hypothetical protein